MAPLPRLILASASPRRSLLLREAGYSFLVRPADVDETPRAGELPGALAERLARAKAEWAARLFPGDVVLGADTVVGLGEICLGKPGDEREARAMLGRLAGTTHEVITGVCVMCGGRSAVERVVSNVRMRNLGAEEIAAYVAGGQWRGKAGGYGLQDRDPFVEAVSGCKTNIVGLPMTTTMRMLGEFGIQRALRSGSGQVGS